MRLFAGHAQLELWRTWPRHILASRQIQLLAAALPQAANHLATALDELGWKGQLHLFIGNGWLRFAALPWALQTGNDLRDTELAASWLAQTPVSGTTSELNTSPGTGWQVKLDAAHFGEDRFLVAIAQDSVQALTLLNSKFHPLHSWQPWAMQAWNTCRNQLEANGTLYIPEPGCLSLLIYENGRVKSLQQRRFPVDSLDGLVSLLHLEELRQGHSLAIMADALPASWQPSLSAVGKILPGNLNNPKSLTSSSSGATA